MSEDHHVATLDGGLRIAYLDHQPEHQHTGVIVLLHGFPQTSYQFRKVIRPLASAGYRVIAPDYRGAGLSSKPEGSFTKTTMAADILHLLDHLSITDPVHMIGHDIGGMVAYAFASRHPERTASLVWGECPLPGTAVHVEDRTAHGVQQFHFLFHSVSDLPEALVSGREELYLSHFFEKLAFDAEAITQEDLDHYVKAYSRPGALRCAFKVYRSFPDDARENREWISRNGKCRVRTLGLSGALSRHGETAERMLGEVHEEGTFRVAEVPRSGHYVAEENPGEFVRIVLDFIGGV